jgi:multimeric flavodoxin WrbA
MNVIAFNGSPHANGTIGTGLGIIAAELEQEGISVEIVTVGSQLIHGCIDCKQCRKQGRCSINDDIVNECAQKVNDSDGIILASPVYYGGIAGTFKSFLDRLFYQGVNLKYKPAAVVASLRRSGGVPVFQELSNYLNLAQAIIVPNVYWSVIYGNTAQELAQDGEGLQIMRTTGKNMAWLLKVLAAGGKEVPVPNAEQRVWTNFIK